MNRSIRCAACLAGVLALVSAGLGAQFTDWGAPVNLGVVVNSESGDFHAFESRDGRSLYFTSSRPGTGGWDLWVSQRADRAEAWGAPVNLGGPVNTAANEGAPFISPGGHYLFFQSDRSGSDTFGGNDLYVSWRQDTQDDLGWGTPVSLGPGVNTSSHEITPALFVDDDTGMTYLYFGSDRPGGPGPNVVAVQGTDIWMSVLGPDGTFGPAEIVEAVSTPSYDRAPFVSRDGRELYVTSDAPGTYGLLDLWVSTRESTTDGWSTPVNLGSNVNGSNNDARPSLSWDGTKLYFQSARPGNVTPQYDLWMTTRSRGSNH